MKIKKLILFILAAFWFSACDEYLDINENPNRSTEVPAGTLLTNSAISLSQVRLTTLNPDAAAYIHHWKPIVVLTGPDIYDYSPIGNNNFWTFTFYTDVIKDLNLAILQEREEGNDNAVAQLLITQAFGWMHGVDRWGEMPFTESNVPGITAPQFDTGDVIYQGIIDILDEAISLIDLSQPQEPFTIVEFDPLYGGNIRNWLAFANSMKLRVLMRVSSVEDRSQDISQLLNSSAEFIDDINGSENAEFEYVAARENQNFDYATFDNFTQFGSFQLDANGNRAHQRWRLASRTLVDILKQYNDPRMDAFYQPNITNTGEITGALNGASPLPPVNERGFVSLFYIRQDKSDEWFLAAEQFLLEAEAYARGLVSGAGMTEAQEALTNGVQASLNHFDGSDFEIEQTSKQEFIDNLPDLNNISNPVEFIQLQQYIIHFYNSNEAWSNWRRTKVPDLPVPVGAPIETIIRRVEIPSGELENNPNAPAVSPLIDVPVYFEP
ncbi:MAG: SusD/RagB family nutrient-binding outer membrane lipoprotein [Candidatus Cyclobacteriaceae bacterium M3_2C_046]